VTDPTGRNLLQIACCMPPGAGKGSSVAQVKLARFLLDQGIELDTLVGKDKCTALFFAVARARNPALIKFLLARGADVNRAPGGGLFAAGWYDDVEHLRILLDAGAEIDKVAGVTPFLASWGWRKFAAAKFLALKGANVNFQDKKGRTALHHGLEKEYEPALLAWLVRHGASPDVKDNEGVSPLLRASRKRDKKFLAALR
jgi:ankyrin repeat protein